MRMDRNQSTTAADLVNRLPERELADLLYRYGEERRSRAVARAIVGPAELGADASAGAKIRTLQPRSALPVSSDA